MRFTQVQTLNRNAGADIRSRICHLFVAAFVFCIAHNGLSETTNSSGGDLLQFLDGSTLHGQLQSMDRNEGVKWDHPLAKTSMQFKPEGLEEIRLKHAKFVSGDTRLSCRFRFSNGDEVYGNLKELNPGSVTLDTRFGQGMRVSRDAIDSIIFLARTFSVLYEGPTNVTGWSMGRSGGVPWVYHDGTFSTEHVGTVGRDFGLPPASSLEFDLGWNGNYGLILQLYTQNIDRFDYGGGSYIFYFNPNSVTLQRVSGETGISNLGQSIPLPPVNRRGSMHVEIRANKEESILALFVDGVLLHKWKDESGFAGKGTGVLYFCQHEDAPIRLSNIKVAEWDGTFEEAQTNQFAKNEDVLRLANRDRVNGKLERLHDGKLSFAAGATTLDIPLPRVTEIIFSGTKTNRPATSPWAIRALLTTGEKFTFELDKWDAEQISGTNVSFGRVAFHGESVRHIQFNLGKIKTVAPPVEENEGEGPQSPSQPPVLLNDQQDTLLLRNSDFLSGTLKSFSATNGLIWQRDDLVKPINFVPTGISEIQCRQAPPSTASNDCQVRLVAGGMLDGSLVALDAEKVVLDTWYAGKISLARKSVQMIIPRQQSRSPVFEGITGVEGWSMGKVTAVPDGGEWSYKDGALYASKAAAIARDIHLPDVASIQFDISWKGTLQMAIALYTKRLEPINLANKDTEPDFGGFYSLQIGSLGVALLSVKKNAPLNYLWPQQLNGSLFSQKNEAHIEIRADKHKSLVALLVDGVVFKQGMDNEGFAGSGTAVRFVHQGMGTLRLSNLKVTEWDGQFEEKFSNTEAITDLVKLRNSDKLTGEVLLKDHKLVVEDKGSKLEIPLERIKQLEFAGKKMETPKGPQSNAVGFFRSGGSVSFHLARWDEKGITTDDPVLGKSTFNPAAFTRIQFNFSE